MKKYSMLLLVFAICALSATAQDNLNTTRVGVWPYGEGNTLALHEDHIFLSYGRVIQIYDCADHQQQQLKGEIFVDERISVFAFADGMAFAAGTNGFFILDIANPEQPQIISQLNIPSSAYGMSLYGDFAYLALNNNYLCIMDISDANNPVMVANHEMQHPLIDIVMMDNLAWIAAGQSGIMAYDLSDPAEPTLVYHYPSSGNMVSLAFENERLLSFNRDLGLMIFDMTNLPVFDLLSTTYIYGMGNKISIENDVIAVTLNWIGFALYDISNPAAPDSLGMFYADLPNRQVVLKDGYAFHCHGSAFNIIDLQTSNEITLLSSIGLSGRSMSANYWNNHIYVSAPAETIMILDITNPQNVVKVSEIEKLEASYEIHVKDNLLFRSYYNQIMVYDVSVPANPILLNSFSTNATPDIILKHNNLLFVSQTGNLKVFDISDIMSPNLLGVFPYNGISDMIAEGDLLYLTSSLNVVILDISDPTNMSQLSSTQNYYSSSLALKDSLLYVVSSVHYSISGKSLHVFNVTDPTSVFRVKSMEQSREFENILVEGDYIYVHERSIGLQIYDIQQLTPVFCGFYSNKLYEAEMQVVNGNIYVPVIVGIDIVHNDFITSIENDFIGRDRRLKLFPNPAGETIHFNLDEGFTGEPLHFIILQSNGTQVARGHLLPGQQQLDLQGLPAGMYVLKLQHKGGAYKSGLFVKQ